MPQNERRFMQIAEQTVELRNGHYQISLPFKDRQGPVPSNKAQAWQRTIWLKKKLERDLKVYHLPKNSGNFSWDVNGPMIKTSEKSLTQ